MSQCTLRETEREKKRRVIYLLYLVPLVVHIFLRNWPPVPNLIQHRKSPISTRFKKSAIPPGYQQDGGNYENSQHACGLQNALELKLKGDSD